MTHSQKVSVCVVSFPSASHSWLRRIGSYNQNDVLRTSYCHAWCVYTCGLMRHVRHYSPSGHERQPFRNISLPNGLSGGRRAPATIPTCWWMRIQTNADRGTICEQIRPFLRCPFLAASLFGALSGSGSSADISVALQRITCMQCARVSMTNHMVCVCVCDVLAVLPDSSKGSPCHRIHVDMKIVSFHISIFFHLLLFSRVIERERLHWQFILPASVWAWARGNKGRTAKSEAIRVKKKPTSDTNIMLTLAENMITVLFDDSLNIRIHWSLERT